MTHFLRFDRKTLVDCDECRRDGQDDLSVVVDIRTFALILLGIDREQKRAEFILDMEAVQELRGEYWEREVVGHPKEHLPNIRAFIERRLCEVAARWNLCYVTD